MSSALAPPLVLVFYRGGWCPYCNLTLAAYDDLASSFAEKGARVVAITPALAENALRGEENPFSFPILIDRDNAVANQFKIAYPLPDAVDDAFRAAGLDVSSANGTELAELPLGATYVIGRDGTIHYAYLDADYRQRGEPSEVLAIVERLSR